MALTVEDGSGVPNANSYGTIAGARAYAVDRGIALSATDSVVSSQLIIGTDFLESFADRYVGRPTSFTQSLSWPRKCVNFDPDNLFPSNQIPVSLVQALYQAVIEQSNGIDLQPTVDHTQGGFIIQEKVDVLETRYSERIGTTSDPLLPKVMALLSGLLNPKIAMTTVRV